MPLYLFKYPIWKYKFQKLAYTIQSLVAYFEIYTWVLLEKIKNPGKKYIGILLAEHLGDIVAAEPLIGALQRKFPEGRICWIAKKNFHDLLNKHPGIYKVLEEKQVYASTLLGRKNPFDKLYNLHINGTRLQPFYEPVFFNPKSKHLNLTVENYYSKNNLLQIFAKFADVELNSDQPKLYVEDKPVNIPFKGDYWVIHTKSNQTSREWKDEKWQELIPKLIERFGIHVIEIGMKNGIQVQHSNFHSLVGKLSILETIHVMKNAKFFIGIDSGPSHIGNALQIPALLILGKYENFTTYMPFSGAYQKGEITKIYFNNSQTAAEHSVEEILLAIEQTYGLTI